MQPSTTPPHPAVPATPAARIVLPFLFACAIVWVLTLAVPDMVRASGDARSIWHTISHWDGARGPSSYVLYKGMLSVYPYIWLREWALAAGMEPFAFIRIYHALLFGVGSTLAVPAIASAFTGRPWAALQRCLFAAALLWLTHSTRAFDMLMIDLPSWAFFAVACWASLRSCDAQGRARFAWAAAAGAFIGLSLCGSGQFGLPALVLGAYVLLRCLSQAWSASQAGRLLLLAQVLVVAVVAWIPRQADLQFHASIVEPMRARGDWLPTGQQWVQNSLFRMLDSYTRNQHWEIPSPRGAAILKDVLGSGFETMHPRIKAGGSILTVDQYLGLVRRYPLDFAAMWTARGFMLISLDAARASASALLAGYTSVFLCLLLVVRRCRTLRDVLRPGLLLLLALLLTVAAPVALFLEMRTALTIHALMLAIGVQVLTSRDPAAQPAAVGFTPLRQRPVPWTWIAYAGFIVACFGFYGVTMELTGSEPRVVLFRP